MKLPLIFALLLTLTYSQPAAGQDGYPLNPGIDVIHYTFKVFLEDSTDLIRINAEITFSATGSPRTMGLDLRNKNENGKGMEVSLLALNDKRAVYSHEKNRINITLPQLSDPFTGTLYISYSGIPADGLIISENKYGERTFFADNWPDRARNWLACVDHPSDKAKVDFIVTAPEHYKVVGTGYLAAEYPVSKPGSQYAYKVTIWKEGIDIPTKVMVIGLADFAWCTAGFSKGVPIQSWVYNRDREAGFIDYQPAVEIMDFFQDLIGPYAYEKLANVQSKTIFGGMENSSCIFYYENSVKGNNGIRSLLAHEIAHQWFGDAVTEKDWYHAWLSEGFATYLEAVYADSTLINRTLQKSMIQMREAIIKVSQDNPKPVIDTTVTDLKRLLNTNTYQKGAWVLHMLRNELGNEIFWKGIRMFYQEFKNRNALTSDFCNIMEKVSGRELDYFFDQWLRQSTQPDIEWTWNYNKGKGTVEFRIVQKDSRATYKFPLTIGIKDEKGKNGITQTVQVNSADTFLSVPVPFVPVNIELDPNVNLLFTSKLVSSEN
jgi:aminopeptidase N